MLMLNPRISTPMMLAPAPPRFAFRVSRRALQPRSGANGKDDVADEPALGRVAGRPRLLAGHALTANAFFGPVIPFAGEKIPGTGQ
jgi:hypothetical protein